MATPVRLRGRHHGAPLRPQGAHRVYTPSPSPRRGGRGGRLSPLTIGVPLFLGICYGAYAQAIARSGGPATWGQLALALISGAVFALLLFALLRVGHALPREVRAAAWGVLVGGSVGFLYSLTGHSVLLSSGIGLAIGAGTAAAAFYHFYMREP
ncbi:hypothetical protein AB0O07_32695 [Streptomyces sp. NPDC093085]|uniref:hypothetical protein n=1 Tax=Streptomyces sp. NPDC093085 TaxID=3155068 RepID=UPI00341BDD4E